MSNEPAREGSLAGGGALGRHAMKKRSNASEEPSDLPRHLTADTNPCMECDGIAVDVASQGIKCPRCKNIFHAVGCQDKYCVASKSVFRDHLKPAVTGAKGYSTKFGHWTWTCPPCYEEVKSGTTDPQLPEEVKSGTTDPQSPDFQSFQSSRITGALDLL